VGDAARATAGVIRGAGGALGVEVAAGRLVGAGATDMTGEACVAGAWASAAGRSIHAVVRPVLKAVTPVRAMPIVASFQ
jgi:hypothetical protein